MLAYKLQMPVNHPNENIQHSEQGKSFEIKVRLSNEVGHIKPERIEKKILNTNNAKIQYEILQQEI
jgi:hypothetical protein